MSSDKPKRGRPSKYTDKLGAAILERLIEGESLRSIFRSPGMPDRLSFYRWLIAHPEFRDHYDLARELQGAAWADEILDVARDGSADITVTPDGETKINSEHVQRSRLRVDALKWILSKLHHKQYGDRTGLEVSTPPGQPFEVSTPLSPAEVTARIGAMLAENEALCRLAPAPANMPDGERLQRILAASKAGGFPISPELYAGESNGSSFNE
jgi:hypothetical protein